MAAEHDYIELAADILDTAHFAQLTQHAERVKDPTRIDYIRATCEAADSAVEYEALQDMTQLEFDVLQLVRFNRVPVKEDE